jgi:formylglycine-generating enzyme required for sulfatase activity
MAMAVIPAGEFQMGSDDTGYQNGYPRHAVHIAEFRMGRYAVTFDQYDAFARATNRPLLPDEGWGRGARPLINVDWSQVLAFIDWVNAGSRRHFRLPSESEWEYAARAHTTTAYWWGDEPNPDDANTAADTGKDVWQFTAPVGSFPANPFGLFDVLGNVWQFVQDCRHLTYLGAPADGSAWVDGNCDSRVVRGGYYGSLRVGMRSNSRGAAGEHFHSMGLGFRLAE